MPPAEVTNVLLGLVAGLLGLVLGIAAWQFRSLVGRLDKFGEAVEYRLDKLAASVASVSTDVAVLRTQMVEGLESRVRTLNDEVSSLRNWRHEHNNLHQRERAAQVIGGKD